MRTTKPNAANAHRHGALLGVCGLLAFMVVFAIAGASAKYSHKTDNQAQAVAAEFYFASDFLSADGPTHTVAALDSGTATVEFTLQNHADALRYTPVDIAYTVTVDDSSVTVDPAGGTIAGGAVRDRKIKLTNLQPGHTYTVTASTTKPYAATLTGTIQVSAADNTVTCAQTDKGQYIEVTISTKDYAGQVDLTYPAGLIPDNTDSRMADWTTGEQTKQITMETNSAVVLRFFKDSGYNSESKVTASAQ